MKLLTWSLNLMVTVPSGIEKPSPLFSLSSSGYRMLLPHACPEKKGVLS
jgi:hypothetical protein